MYQFESRIRFSEVDDTGHLDMASLINYLQDCSLFHAEEVGLGLSYYIKHKKAWFLTSWQIEVIRFPGIYEKIRIATYPHNFKSFMGDRSFVITDEQGDICAKADSTWIYMNTELNKPVRALPHEIEPFAPISLPDADYNKKKRIRLVPGMDKLETIPVLPSYIDTNHHMNNGQYVKLAQNYLPLNFHPVHIQVDYVNAAKKGDILYPMTYISDSSCIIAFTNVDEKPYAVMEFVS